MSAHEEAPKSFDVSTYSGFTETPPEVLKDVIVSAEKAYQKVGAALGISPDSVYLTPNCVDVIDQMGNELLNVLQKGYRALRMDVTFLFKDHQYISIVPPNSERRIIADPTWQQFLPAAQRTPDKPKVIIGTPEEVGKQLLSYGFTDQQVTPWFSKEEKPWYSE